MGVPIRSLVPLSDASAIRDMLLSEDGKHFVTITLTTNWEGSELLSQPVTISGVTASSKVDFRPSAATMTQLKNSGIKVMYAANNNGAITVYAVGETPTSTITIDAMISEVRL